ncbi:SufD family Fe-S cluster assembly protein [Maribius pontilimi]|uniref:SufD family Fe-S cluster assembly protein n=1 Tax=Palleronia pontilimi TaxID=1964209 RepID=A0A934IGJ4_9RHOB|nr:SufD family Fe-S cluster assembly protein [Palleronia pontilimi]MBJ3763015.1 SufD family Fe-S cluster assembly protein [Palleronia pontilimi]
MALAKPKQDATDARLADLSLPTDTGWSLGARQEAVGRLKQMGLPQPRDEYWRFTSPRDFNAVAPVAAAPMDVSDETPLYADRDTLKIVFVDGVFNADASDALALEGVEIARLADAGQADIHWARELYGHLEARGQNPVERPLTALNTAFASDGVLLRVTGRVSRPVQIVYDHRDAGSDAILHHVVQLTEGAELTLLESGPVAARFNTVLEADIADGATLHHVRTQGRNHDRRAATASFARLGANATFKSFTLTANGALTRNEHVVEFLGDDSVAHVAGAAIGDAKTDPMHHDDTVFVTHDALRCESRQVFKKVLKNGAVGVFQGKILVKKDAQKTDGYQISQSLLLDDDSQFLAKPELEIYADDVVCSHGSTTGAIDEDALFYLRSRGVPKARAEDLLVLSFLAETLEEIDDKDIASEIAERLDAWLARHAG